MQGAQRIYLDWNATTPPHPEVVEAVRRAQLETWGNPSSNHATGRRARSLLEQARETIAEMFACHQRDVLFTSSATEANNIALTAVKGLATSQIEHPSVTSLAVQLEKRGVPVHWLPVDSSGVVSLEAAESALEVLPVGSTLALMAANHETGVLQPIAAARQLSLRLGARLHVDASQILGKLGAEAYRDADSLALSAHKLRGPQGIGALIWKGPAPEPVLRGGAQERGARPGTQPAALAEGFRVALGLGPWAMEERRRLAALRDRWEQAWIGIGEINGEPQGRLPHVSNVSVGGWPGPELVAALDLEGVEISSGSACSAGTSEPSPVINAMLGAARARSAVRFSIGPGTRPEHIDKALAALFRVLGDQSSRT